MSTGGQSYWGPWGEKDGATPKRQTKILKGSAIPFDYATNDCLGRAAEDSCECGLSALFGGGEQRAKSYAHCLVITKLLERYTE